MKISGVILAAGASRRMGQSKALLEYRGETFVGRLRRVLSVGCFEVIVVGPPGAGFAAEVVNPEPQRGMLSSLQCGLLAVAPDSDGVMFTLADLPAVNEGTIRLLAGGWGGELLRIPRYRGKRGHPVLMARRLMREFLAAAASPREVIARHEGEIVYVEVEDPGVVTDADTREDYLRLVADG